MLFKRIFPGLCILCLMVLPTLIQAQQKKILDHSAYEIWNRITRNQISPDGNWIQFTLGPEDKDHELRIKDLSGQRFMVPRGDSAQFSNDSRYSVFYIRAYKDSIKQARKDKKKPDQMPKDSLGILDLSTGDLIKIARIKSYKLPEKGSGWVAYLLEKEKAGEDTPDSSETEEEKPKQDDSGKKSKKKKAEGTTLVVHRLEDNKETRHNDVISYDFSEDGKHVVYIASNKDSTADGVYLVNVESGEVTTIIQAKGGFDQAVFDKAGTQVAFLSNHEEIKQDQPAHKLYLWKTGSKAARPIASAESPGIPSDWWLSEHGNVSFSDNGKRLFFGTAPRPEEEPDEEETEEPEVKLDVWHWKDPYLQPMQLVRLKNEQKRSYLAVAHLDKKGRIVQLANRDIPSVTVGKKGDGDIAYANSNIRYRHLISWEWPRYYDVYLINVADGRKRLILEKTQATAELSPDLRYITWWDRSELAWFAQNVDGGNPVNLTKDIIHPVYNEIHDWPYEPNPYGRAGWIKGDQSFLVYDKYDIWSLDPSGKKEPMCLTDGAGRKNGLRFRYVRLDREEDFIDPKAPMLLSAFHLKNKQAGFYRDSFDENQEPVTLVMSDHSFSTPRKAKDADRVIYSRSSFQEFPDLWVSDLQFNDMQRMSDANPQQSEYLWGTAELVEWTSLDGIPLQGILYKPEDFDPENKYPMMVYFYEKMSNSLHRHRPPATARSSISFSFYVSRGYIVFVPDIPYKVGFPGESALNAVVPGVLHVKSLGFVDGDRIGVQGHSWGGYQIAYLVTQTNIFKAAEAGAPVSNMTSAYGGIRWGSGMSRMFQYEQTQSRIGGSLWEYPMRYIENSPLFWADKIETPVLMMHNDQDGAVPWYQGIEFFVALRRLGKQAWMLNYNGEKHGLGKYENKRDWAIRMQQFFDHFLRDAPAPLWLEEGIPAIKKGKTLGLEPAGSGESIASGTQ